MSGIAAKVRAGAWLALGALVVLYLVSYQAPEVDSPVITPLPVPLAPADPGEEEPGGAVAVDVALKAAGRGDATGEAKIRYRNGIWMWEDGIPVAGSTPERLVKALADLEAAFVQDNADDLAKYGLTDPLARAVLTDREGQERVVLIGGRGEPDMDPEGRSRPRYYATVEGSSSVYLVSDHALRVIRDLVKERSRKAEKDAEKAERQARGAAAMARRQAAGDL